MQVVGLPMMAEALEDAKTEAEARALYAQMMQAAWDALDKSQASRDAKDRAVQRFFRGGADAPSVGCCCV